MTVVKITNKNKIPKKYKGAKELWYFRVSYIDVYGNKKRHQEGYFTRQKDAVNAQTDFLLSIKDLESSNHITFKELTDDYLKWKKDKVKVTTYQSNINCIRYLKSLDKIEVETMTTKQFENWKNEININNFSTEYKNTIYKNLKSILNYGKKMYNLNMQILNRMTNFTNPNELKKEMDFYTEDDFKKFISYEDDIKWICFFNTLFYCGLRQGEALALNWNDIDFDDETIKINKTLTNQVKGEKYTILPPKTKGSNRIIPIPKHLKQLLETRYNIISKYSNFKKDWFVFGDIFPLARTTIQLRRDNLCKQSNVKKIRIHDFRHSCASFLISKGANITLVARFLGHDNIATTLNTYSHFYKNDLKELINNIN